jgi:hypothetical protein
MLSVGNWSSATHLRPNLGRLRMSEVFEGVAPATRRARCADIPLTQIADFDRPSAHQLEPLR